MSKPIPEGLWELLPLLFRPHPWHGISVGDEAPDKVTAYIEIVPTDPVKYELDKTTGYLKIDRPQKFSNVYPSLYGFIPQTFCGEENAAFCAQRTGRDGIVGDGDPLDVCVLGPTVPIGSVVKARPIGILTLLDNGEIDDKVLLVMQSGPFAKVSSLADLDKRFPGVTPILQTWFTHYKGYGKDGKIQLTSPGFKGRAATIKTIGDAIQDFEMSVVTEADKRPLDEKGNPYLYRWPGAKNIGE